MSRRRRADLVLPAVRLADRTGLNRSEAFSTLVEAGIHAEASARLARGLLSRKVAPHGVSHWEDSGHGPGVVLVNGWSASGRMWSERFVKRLEAGHRVLRIDNRGTGQSRRAFHPYTIGDLAGDVRRMLAETGVEKPVVVGLSMGGMIAQELALRWPDLVGGLVLVGTLPPCPARVFGDTAAILDVFRPREAGIPLADYMRRWVTASCAPGFAERDPTAIEEVVAAGLARLTPTPVLMSQLRAAAAWHDAGRLRSITVPTVVVHGDVDPLAPVINGMRLAALIPGARYVELVGIGHLVPYEAPDRLAEIIEELGAAQLAAVPQGLPGPRRP